MIIAYEPNPKQWDSEFRIRKNDKMRKCFNCKGNMIDDFSNYMVDVDGRFIIVRNVPCHKCSQCGEVSYSGEVVARLEEIVAKLKEALTEVAIVEYAA